eukprot:CAMPEP_0197397058 /NCGR_PEP_ID=MMETSP1165-20131217/10796_1 /TAXON_ID=284809 /ORGANISM="Chrysocystis fragilis, Strain CCMP3189" /LENGTH=239 /DNA_ID=CAMNT_0042922933 /DNA_START=30 /DNA_END=746 /DNA_ORIENTATION=-
MSWRSPRAGDPESVRVVNEAKYVQHNPQTAEGSEGLAALFARISKSSPRVNVVRAFADGDFVFAHTEYDFSTRKIGFEVFRFEGDQAVEHWDNIQPREGPNLSGRTMVDGETEPTDAERTEANRERARAFVSDVLLAKNLDLIATYVDEALIQHNPRLADGLHALRAYLDGPAISYERCHRLLADGSFALAVCEGARDGVHTAFYDLFRFDSNGVIVEHWDTIEHVAPPELWKNDNGKF